MKDTVGRTILLPEKVALSDRVNQPILCYGHLLENGWSIDATHQTLSHSVADADVPLELQSKSVTVQGTICMLRLQETNYDCLHVRAIQADVNEDLATGSVGWKLDARGCGIGRHFSDRHQDPLLVKPDMPGHFHRTTLVQGRNDKWFVLELCEQMDGLVQMDAEFHECRENET